MTMSPANSSQSAHNETGSVFNSCSQIMNGIAKRMPTKGKLASKLSSRHNRRKRRGRDDKERLAKRSRNNEKVPIPSFTPIIEEDHIEEAVNGGENAATGDTDMLKCSFVCTTDRDLGRRNDPNASKQIIADTAPARAITSEISGNSTNRVDKRQNVDCSDSHVAVKLACSNDPSYSKQTLSSGQKQQSVLASKSVQAKGICNIEDIETVPGGICASDAKAEHSHYALKANNTSVEPAKMIPEASAQSMPAMAQQKAKEQHSAPSVTINGLTGQCPPLVANDTEKGNPLRHNLRKEDYSGVGNAKESGVRLVDEICFDPKKDKIRSMEVSQMKNAEASSNGSCSAGPSIEDSLHAVRQNDASTEPTAIMSRASSPIEFGAVPQMEGVQPLHRKVATEDASSSHLTSAVKNGESLGAEKVCNTMRETESGGVNATRLDKKLIDETRYGAKKVTQSHSRNDTPHSAETSGTKTESDLEIEALIDNVSAKKAKSFTSDNSSSLSMIQQPHKEQKPCSAYVVKSASSAKTKESKRDKAGPPEVIEIIDDDDCYETTIPIAKKKQSLSSISTEKKKDFITNKKKSNKSNQAKKKRKTTANISRSSSDSSSIDEAVYATKRSKKPGDKKGTARRRNQKKVEMKVDDTPSKQPNTSAGKKLCFACSSCKCNSRSGTAATPQKFSALGGSDARQEQSLVNRMQRIERDISWKEGQRNDVARDLKKHRRRMLKKWEDQPSHNRCERPRFLADAKETEKLGDLQAKTSLKETKRANRRFFGNQRTHQPTLTQIIRGPENDDGDKELPTSDNRNGIKLDYKEESTVGSKSAEAKPGDPSSSIAAKSHEGEDGLLPFWADTAPIKDSTQCLGSMDSFNQAIVDWKTRQSTGKWAKATADTLEIEEEEGFDALVDLFDASMECKRSNDIGCSSQDSYDCDDDDFIFEDSPNAYDESNKRCKTAAGEIKKSVEENPTKMAAIERMCPNWKENVELCQAQTDPNALQNALQNVQQAKEDLENMKERILQAFIDRQQTLDLYERSIQVANDGLSVAKMTGYDYNKK